MDELIVTRYTNLQRVILAKDAIENLFADATHQADVLIALYAAVIPDWDDVTSINGWPKITENTSKEFFRLFMRLDEKNHPDVLPGGLWMNKGFGTYDAPDDLQDWEVDYSNCKIRYD